MGRLHIVPTRHQAGFGLAYLGIELFILPSVLALSNAALGAPLTDAALNFVYFSLNFLAVIAIFRQFLRDSFAFGLHSALRTLSISLASLGVYFLLNFLLSALILHLYPDFANVNDSTIASMARQEFYLVAAGTVFLVPLTEETMFRGLLFGRFCARSKPLAYFVSTAAFSAIHILNYIGTTPPEFLVLSFLQYIPAGLCLAAAYDLSGSMLAPVLMHTAINAIGIFSVR